MRVEGLVRGVVRCSGIGGNWGTIDERLGSLVDIGSDHRRS